MKMRNLTTLVSILAFSTVGLTACGGQVSPPDASSTQTQRSQALTGTLSADFQADNPRLVAIDQKGQHRTASIEGDRFRLALPKGHSYSLYVAGQNAQIPGEAVQVVFPRVDGTVDHTFAVRQGGGAFDLGTVRPAGKLGSAQFSVQAPDDGGTVQTSRQGLNSQEESDAETGDTSESEESETLSVEDEEADVEKSCEKEHDSDDDSDEKEEKEDDTEVEDKSAQEESDDGDNEDAEHGATGDNEKLVEQQNGEDDAEDNGETEDESDDEESDDSENHREPCSEDEVAVPETSQPSSFDGCDESENENEENAESEVEIDHEDDDSADSGDDDKEAEDNSAETSENG